MIEILVAVAMLAVLLFVHEIGHYAAAKRLGIEVVELALGFGKKLFQWVSPRSGTAYTLRLLPFGGYNRFLSELDLTGRHAAPSSAYEAFPVWKRFVTVAAGPAANLLLALVLSTGLWVTNQLCVDFTACAEAPAAVAEEKTEVQENLFLRSFQVFGDIVQMVADSPDSVVAVIGGPVSAVQALRRVVAEDGLHGVMTVMTLSSVSVGLFNLLPIPGLDGSQLLMLAIEKARGRKCSERVQNAYEWVCLASVAILFGVMIFNDVSLLVQYFFS